jgi:hypothetical protein
MIAVTESAVRPHDEDLLVVGPTVQRTDRDSRTGKPDAGMATPLAPMVVREPPVTDPTIDAGGETLQ